MAIHQEVEDILNVRETESQKKSARAKKGQKAKSVKKATKKEQQIIDLSNNTVLPDHYFTVYTSEELDELCEFLIAHQAIAVDTETMGVKVFEDDIVGISFYAPHRGYYIPLKHVDDDIVCLPKNVVTDALKPILEDPDKKLLFHNAKFDCHILYNWMGIDIRPYFDTMIAQALLDENQSKALKDLAPLYLGVPADKYGTIFGKTTFDKVPIKLNPHTRTGNLASYYAIKDTELTFNLARFQAKALARPELFKMSNLFFDIEMPFLQIVVEAERHGARLNIDYLENTVAKQLHEELELLRRKIWHFTGQINLNSPAQLAEALYHKLELPRVNIKKPDSTDKKTLKKLKPFHEIAGLLLEYRGKVKLTTAFAEKLPKETINGRVHTSFNPVGTKTGRMSCNSPNLQQIPAKVGGLIRNAFISDQGRLLASIDFSQQELRVLAHVSQDETLLAVYRDGKDVHSMTAVSMWNMDHPKQNIPYEEFEYRRSMTDLFQDKDGNIEETRFTDEVLITKLFNEGKITSKDPKQLKHDAITGINYEKIRKKAKVVNFGIIYGMQEGTLSDTLEITEEEAIVYIKAYFAQYPGVARWMEEQREIILAHSHSHHTETMLGRKRRVYNEVTSGKWWLLQKGFRMGINAIIQGSSADMVKKASIDLQPTLKELDSRILLWVHDEIIFDVPENIGMDNLQRIADIMCNALPLDCGLKSDIEVGQKWGQKLSDDELDFLAEEDIA